MTVLIYAYKPDERLLELIDGISEICSFNIVIVDDGSGKAYSSIFRSAEEKGCTLLTHEANPGRGRALKTGFRYIKNITENDGVVCVDSGRWHLPGDILKIAENINEYKSHIILGSRHFNSKIPVRSRFYSMVSGMVFRFSTGAGIHDIQTDLRGYSCDMLDWLSDIPGEGYEYEMNVLLEAADSGKPFKEIQTGVVYHKNHSSDFMTFRDSVRVCLPLLKFSATSLLSGIIDFVLLIIIKWLSSNLLLSVAAARTCSSVFNYYINKAYVFSKENKAEPKNSMVKYFALALLVMGLNYGLMHLFNEILYIPLVIAKLLTEAILFLFSFWSQRNFVFKAKSISN